MLSTSLICRPQFLSVCRMPSSLSSNPSCLNADCSLGEIPALLPPYLPILLAVPTVCYSAHHPSSTLGKDKEPGAGILTAHFCTTNRLLPFHPAIAQMELDFSGGSFLFWQTLENREACACVQGTHTSSIFRPPDGFADTCPQRM